MRRASGINPFIFIPKLVDSNREYISYGFRTIYSLPYKLNLDLKFLISFHENIILFLFYFYYVTSFLTLQRCKVTVLHLLNRELYCLKLTRDYVTTLINYKGWIAYTTKVG